MLTKSRPEPSEQQKMTQIVPFPKRIGDPAESKNDKWRSYSNAMIKNSHQLNQFLANQLSLKKWKACKK